MLCISEIKLFLDYDDIVLEEVILKKLGVSSKELISYIIFKCSYDVCKWG